MKSFYWQNDSCLSGGCTQYDVKYLHFIFIQMFIKYLILRPLRGSSWKLYNLLHVSVFLAYVTTITSMLTRHYEETEYKPLINCQMQCVAALVFQGKSSSDNNNQHHCSCITTSTQPYMCFGRNITRKACKILAYRSNYYQFTESTAHTPWAM